MKDKFMKILSPITLAVIAVLDVAVIGYGIYAIMRICEIATPKAIIFLAADLVALVLAVLVTREELSHGVKFYDDEFEFNYIDNDNIFSYDDILSVEAQKDTKPSLVKNLLDRGSKIVLTLKDERIVTIEIGLTTKRCAEKIADEIKARLEKE